MTSVESDSIMLADGPAVAAAGPPVPLTVTTPVEVAVSLSLSSQLFASKVDCVAATGLMKVVTATLSAFSVCVQEMDKDPVVLLSDFVVEADPAVGVTVKPVTVAEEGATERTPKPIAATTASAIRLKVVLLDICFLSIVVTETFSVAALR